MDRQCVGEPVAAAHRGALDGDPEQACQCDSQELRATVPLLFSNRPPGRDPTGQRPAAKP